MTRPPKPPSNLWELLDEEERRVQRPENGITTAEFAARYGYSISTARNRIAQLLRQKKLVVVGKFGPKLENVYIVKERE